MHRLKILILYDVEGWAWWHKARALQEHLSPRFDVILARHDERPDGNGIDYAVLFGLYMPDLVPGIPPRKRILGLSNTLQCYVDKAVSLLTAGAVRTIAANSRIGFDMLRAAGVGNVHLCQNGVDESVFFPAPAPPAEPVCCWVGNPNSDGLKGLDLIHEACRKAGAALRHHACDASGGDRAGILSQEAIRDTVYHRAHAYICASASEATPNPALEALACGLPVITTPVGNMPEIILDGVNGFFVERGVESIARGIERLRAADRAAMGRAARASIENGWTWAHKARNYEAMLLELAREDGLLP